MHDRTRQALEDMIHHAQAAHNRMAGVDVDDLMAEADLRWILERTLEIVGKAARRVPPAVAEEIDIPWRDIIGLRHRIAHGYDAMDHATLLRIAHEDLSPLVQELERYLIRH